jgi:TPR repeat protein
LGGGILRVVLFLLVLFTSSAMAETLQDGYAAYQRGDYRTAFRIWKPIAEQGDADAQYNLGVMYANGTGVAEDYVQAVYWYRKAVDQGHVNAQNSMYNLGAKSRGASTASQTLW